MTEEAEKQGGERNVPVMIISVDGDADEVEWDTFGSRVSWVTVPQSTLDHIVQFLNDPEAYGVRLVRPRRETDTFPENNS